LRNSYHGSVLPDTYTCTGASETPPVSWLNVPAGTRSLVLVLDDPDAPAGTFTHWIVYNIPTGVREIPRAGLDAGLHASGVCEEGNSAGSTGYIPPCPPPGKPHRYIFTLYAADMVLPQVTVNRAAVSEALAGHTIGQAQFVTTFGR
jgi:Raf kinase inhibitor-like YbhB/YbcL family protein